MNPLTSTRKSDTQPTEPPVIGGSDDDGDWMPGTVNIMTISMTLSTMTRLKIVIIVIIITIIIIIVNGHLP